MANKPSTPKTEKGKQTPSKPVPAKKTEKAAPKKDKK